MLLARSFPTRRQVHAEPPVYLVDGFLSESECAALMDAADGRLQDAHVVGRGDGATNSFGYRQARHATRRG